MENKKGFQIHRVKDSFESMRVPHPLLFPLPFKILICGKSMLSAKSSLIINLLLKKDGYLGYFKGDNTYIVNPSTALDKKFDILRRNMKVPKHNIFLDFDDSILEELYDDIQERVEEDKREGNKVEHSLLILDDVAYTGGLKGKQMGIITKIAANSRHIGLNLIATSQKYSLFSPTLRENATQIICSSSSLKQIELIYEDNSILPHKEFLHLFLEYTKVPYSWFVIDYSATAENRYKDSNFNVIPTSINKMEGYFGEDKVNN